MKVNIEQLVELSMEVNEDIPWGLVNITEPRYSMEVVATNVYKMYEDLGEDPERRELILLVTIINLMAENFVLNTQVGLMD